MFILVNVILKLEKLIPSTERRVYQKVVMFVRSWVRSFAENAKCFFDLTYTSALLNLTKGNRGQEIRIRY